MKITLVVVGKVKAPFAEADAQLPQDAPAPPTVEVIEVRDEVNLEGRIPTRSHVIALDRGGRALSSKGLGELGLGADAVLASRIRAATVME